VLGKYSLAGQIFNLKAGESAYRRVGVSVWNGTESVGLELHPALAGLVRVIAPRDRAKARPYPRWSYGAFRRYADTPIRRYADTAPALQTQPFRFR
jgi:hypothetical protein